MHSSPDKPAIIVWCGYVKPTGAGGSPLRRVVAEVPKSLTAKDAKGNREGRKEGPYGGEDGVLLIRFVADYGTPCAVTRSHLYERRYSMGAFVNPKVATWLEGTSRRKSVQRRNCSLDRPKRLRPLRVQGGHRVE